MVKALDEKRITLDETAFAWELYTEYEVKLEVKGTTIKCSVGGKELTATDGQYADGALGFIVVDGGISAGNIKISPVT